jgi:type 2 lantibiotic biosynthesis protein LanM
MSTQSQTLSSFDWDSYLRKLVSSASTPAERLNAHCFSLREEMSTAAELDSWIDAACDGDADAFAQRLALDSWTIDDAKRGMQAHDYKSSAPLPTWAQELGVALPALDIPTKVDSNNIIGFRNQPYIFQQIWLPLCNTIAQEVKRTLQTKGIDFSRNEESVLFDALFHLLLGHLSRVGSSAVYAEFAKFRSVQNALGSATATMPGSQQLYHRFVLDVLRKRYITLFEDYPVLARFIGTICYQWRAEAELVMSRWHQDKDSFNQHFGSEFSGTLTEVRTALSDRHNGGQRCMMLLFSTGAALMYKPRGLPNEQAFGLLCKSLASKEHFHFDNKTPNVWNRDDYGWEEVISSKSCETIEEVENYFYRAGQLLCLTFILGGKDFHHENIIACGEYPVLIDLEAMASHQLDDRCPLFSGASRVLYDSFFFDSVLSTSMLSVRVLDEQDRVWDLGGFTGGSEEQAFEILHGWEMPNTDAVRPIRYDYPLESTDNKVFFNEKRQHLKDHFLHFEKGFKELYRNLATEEGHALIAECTKFFDNQNSRFLFRDTAGYTKLLQSLMTNSVMRSGDQLWLKLERLWRTMSLNNESSAYSKAVVSGEQNQIIDLDVPVFYVSTKTTEMTAPGDSTPIRVFRAPADREILDRAANLSEAHLEKQLQSISLTLRTSSLHKTKTTESFIAREKTPTIRTETISDSYCRDIACSIGERMLDEAVVGGDESLAWLSLVANRRTMSTQIGPMPARLYDGLCGPAILFALLEDICGDTQTQAKMAVGLGGSLHEIAKGIEKRDYRRALLYDGIGALSGLASIVYTLIYIYRINSKVHYLDLADQYASLITESQIQKDQYLDITSGTAGAIRVLALLESLRPKKETRSVIEAGRSHLRNKAVYFDDSVAWHTTGPTAVSGFAHGASGIAYALQEADNALSDFVSADLIDGALRFERQAFDANAKNWRRSKGGGAELCGNRWCEGAPGIGVARLVLRKSLSSSLIEEELALAIEVSRKQDSATLDQLCCGAFGAVDLLISAARELNEPKYFAMAKDIVARRLSKVSSPLELQCGLPASIFPTPFFQGLTGLAYVFARLASNKEYPSVLMLE